MGCWNLVERVVNHQPGVGDGLVPRKNGAVQLWWQGVTLSDGDPGVDQEGSSLALGEGRALVQEGWYRSRLG